MAHAARLGALTDDLIASITTSSVHKESRQFRQLKDSALRTFKTHQHVRVNQFDIDSRLEGLIEKFAVLNNEPLAEALKPRLDELSAQSSKWRPEILALFLALSDRPVDKTNLEKVLEVLPPEPVTQLTWADILADDPLNEEGVWDDVENESDYSEHRAPSLSEVSEAEQTTSTQASSLGEEDVVGIARAFVVPTETGALDKIRALRDRLSNLHAESEITELRVVRQVLSMLHSLPTEMFDIARDGQVRVRVACRVANIDPSTLNRILESFSDLGSRLSVARSFIASAQRNVVLQSFQAALEASLRDFDKAISKIEQDLLLPDTPAVVSLIDTHTEIDCISASVVRLASLLPDDRRSGSTCALQVIDRLFEETCTLQLIGEESQAATIARLFFSCLDPYLRFVKLWMVEGKLQDPDGLFFVRSDDRNTDRGSIWQSRFTLSKHADGSTIAPMFLQGDVNGIFRAGKSVMFLDALGHGNNTFSTDTSSNNLDTEDIINSMNDTLLPFSEVLKSAITQWIHTLEGPGTKTLRQVLTAQSGLQSTIQAINHLYLGCNGALFQSFSYALFARIDRDSSWDDRFLLTELAQTAFENVDSVDKDNISVRVKPAIHQDTKSSSKRGSKALERVVLDYSITWALQNVLTKDTLTTCHQAFTTLLRIHRAHYLLNQQEWSLNTLPPRARDTRINQLLFLRQRLVWFINTFHSHIAQMLWLVMGQLQTDLETATDVDGMAAAFDAFRRGLESKLLLQTNLEPISRAVVVILDLYEDFALEWNDMVKGQSSATLSQHSGHRPSHSADADDAADFSADEDHGEVGSRTREPGVSVEGLLRQYERQLSFTLAGLRGVSRVEGELSWVMLSERLEWGMVGRR